MGVASSTLTSPLHHDYHNHHNYDNNYYNNDHHYNYTIIKFMWIFKRGLNGIKQITGALNSEREGGEIIKSAVDTVDSAILLG